MFQKKAPKGIEPEAGEEGQAPIAEVKRPKKKGKKKPAKTFAKDHVDRMGKIEKMLGKANSGIAADVFAELRAKKNKKRGEGKESNKKKTSRFVPQQERMGIRG